MRLSSKIRRCDFSPVRKFYPNEEAALERGLTIRHLNIGQPDIPTPASFFDAVRDYRESVVPYAPAPGIPLFLEAVRDYYGTLGCALTCDDILATFGGSEALQFAMSCILEEGDEILMPEPFYPNYTIFVNITGGSIRPIPTTAEEGYHFASREKLEPLIGPHTRAILVTHPGNPTGAVLDRQEMEVLVDVAREHNLFLISDEVYREIVYSGSCSTMLSIPGGEENVVVVDSVSKRFSATGSRVGVLVSRNRELMDAAMKLAQGRLCITTLDQLGAAAMYRALGGEYYAQVREEYRRRRDALLCALSRVPGVDFTCPEGAFYLMVGLPVDDAESLQYFLLDEFQDNGETVMFTPGGGFYADPVRGRSKARLAYVTAPEDLTRAVELLDLGIRAYNGRARS